MNFFVLLHYWQDLYGHVTMLTSEEPCTVHWYQKTVKALLTPIKAHLVFFPQCLIFLFSSLLLSSFSCSNEMRKYLLSTWSFGRAEKGKNSRMEAGEMDKRRWNEIKTAEVKAQIHSECGRCELCSIKYLFFLFWRRDVRMQGTDCTAHTLVISRRAAYLIRTLFVAPVFVEYFSSSWTIFQKLAKM